MSSVLIAWSLGNCGRSGGHVEMRPHLKDGGWGIQGTWMIAESLPRVSVPHEKGRDRPEPWGMGRGDWAPCYQPGEAGVSESALQRCSVVKHTWGHSSPYLLPGDSRCTPSG